MAYNRGNDERAAQAFRLAIDAVRPYEATERPLLARSYADFARVLYRQKRYEEAEPLAKWAAAVRESQRGAKAAQVAESLRLLAQIERARHRPGEAEPALKRAIKA